MNLHRSGRRPDWLRRPSRSRNIWQQMAGSTHGLVTPGNFFTVLGFAGVIGGLYAITQQRPVAGLTLIATGRLCDLVDGWLADLTGTKSPLGELLDAGADKLETAAAIVILVIADIVPMWAAIILLLLQTAIVVAVVLAKRHDKKLKPSRSGKLSMAFAWAALTGFVLAYASGVSIRTLMNSFAYLCLGSCLILGIYALAGYRAAIYD